MRHHILLFCRVAESDLDKMGILDIVISKDKMLASPANYKLWKTTMAHVFEKEDLWDCMEPSQDETADTSSTCGATRSGAATKDSSSSP